MCHIEALFVIGNELDFGQTRRSISKLLFAKLHNGELAPFVGSITGFIEIQRIFLKIVSFAHIISGTFMRLPHDYSFTAKFILVIFKVIKFI